MVAVQESQRAEKVAEFMLETFAKAEPFGYGETGQPYIRSSDYYRGEVRLGTHRPKGAEAFFRAAIDITRRAAEPQWRTARSTSGLGEALYRQGRADEAKRYLVDSYRILATDPNSDAAPLVAARERVERFYADRTQPDRRVANP